MVIAAGNVVQLVSSAGPAPLGPGPVYYNLLNLGPDSVYLRQGADPIVGNPNSETLPAMAADNMILVANAQEGLRVRAGASGATVTVRVAVPQYA